MKGAFCFDILQLLNMNLCVRLSRLLTWNYPYVVSVFLQNIRYAVSDLLTVLFALSLYCFLRPALDAPEHQKRFR